MIDMLIIDYPDWNQPTVAQVLIPEAAYRLTPVLEKIDKLLQDESYEYPIVDRFNTQRDRPSVPVPAVHQQGTSPQNRRCQG